MHNKIILAVLSFFVVVDVGLIYLATHISPMKLKRNTFTFQYGETIPTDASEYVNATDSVLAEVVLDLSNVSHEVGTYMATATYYSQVETFEIVIVDTVQPKVVLKKVTWEISIGETIYAEDLIESIEDNSATTTYFIDEETQETSASKTYYTSGSHVERIIVIDEHGNQSTSLRVKITVKSNDTTPPIIYGADDVTIKVGDTFDLLEGVSAYDETDGWISSSINVEGVINTDEAGYYEIEYRVSDSSGNESVVTRMVSVIDN